MSDILDAALCYAARGWLVFPAYIEGKQKKSYKKAEFSGGRRWGATRDPREIRRDFRRWPDAMIGLPTGPDSGFWVLDVDTKGGKDGYASLAALISEHGFLPETLMAKSPSGSLHYYFNWPSDTITQGALAIGIDVRGDGGMALAPPSRRADGVYKWTNALLIADAPQWLVDLATAQPSDYPEAPSWLKDENQGIALSTDPNDVFAETTREDVEAALAVIDPDCSEEMWRDIGTALKDWPFEIFDEWSARGENIPALPNAESDSSTSAPRRAPQGRAPLSILIRQLPQRVAATGLRASIVPLCGRVSAG